MARKYTLNRFARDLSRIQAQQLREQERIQKTNLREEEKLRKEQIRQQKDFEKSQKEEYLNLRCNEEKNKNDYLKLKISELETILERALQIDHRIDFNKLLKNDKFPEYKIPEKMEFKLEEPQEADFMNQVKAPNSFLRLINSVQKKYENDLAVAREDFLVSLKNYQIEKVNHVQQLEKHLEEYKKEKNLFEIELEKYNNDVSDFRANYFSGDIASVINYYELVLENSKYPDDFPKEFQIAYVPPTKELIINYELPNTNVIPEISFYKYIKTKDEMQEKKRSVAEIKNLYQDVVASICLRTLFEAFQADQSNNVDVVVFNGFVNTIDPATGKGITPCLISIKTSKERFGDLNLLKVEKKACLRNLGAQVSSRAYDKQPVKPIIEFDMVDKRFIDQENLIPDLENRSNLMDLNPYEFENFVSNLFELIGFETKLTRSSKDGGVDVVAYDPRPILGGKVVIQAKRYKNVVGVAAVRDLYGTMINEGANKGILVTTSHYGADAYEFSKDKPIELIDGGGLLYLLEQQGVKVKIIFPEDS